MPPVRSSGQPDYQPTPSYSKTLRSDSRISVLASRAEQYIQTGFQSESIETITRVCSSGERTTATSREVKSDLSKHAASDLRCGSPTVIYLPTHHPTTVTTAETIPATMTAAFHTPRDCCSAASCAASISVCCPTSARTATKSCRCFSGKISCSRSSFSWRATEPLILSGRSRVNF
jgi:hypothetical protein